MPRGANILRNISNMSPSMLSDQKEQLLLVWMLTEGLDGAGGKHNFSAGGLSVLQYHPDKKDYISLGCWLQKQ